jgi:hypothetical protein
LGEEVIFQTLRPYRTGGGGGTGRITPVGYNFVDAAGQIVIRKSLTGFCAPKRYRDGRSSEVREFYSWAKSEGLNETRPFSRVDWAGPPSSGVETGWEYNESDCEAMITDAAAAGLRVQLVAHTGKYADFNTMLNHWVAVDQLCSRHENGLFGGYNEPQQNGGNDLVGQLIRAYTPQTPGWASGVYDPTPHSDVVVTGYTAEGNPIYAATNASRVGTSMTYHSPRKDEWSRCTKDDIEFNSGQGPNAQFSPGYPGPVMLDEPPQIEQTIRDQARAGWDVVDDWTAYGAGGAFFGCGFLLHSNPTLQQCLIPTDPTFLACVRGAVTGSNAVPVQRYHGYDRGTPPSDNLGSRRYFRWGDDNKKYELCIRPFSFKAL